MGEQGIGFSCMKGKKPESPNQDSFGFLLAEGEFALYLVLDGHGPKGHDVSSVVLERIIESILRKTKRSKADFQEAFLEAQKFVEDLTQDTGSDLDATMSGTTVTMAYHDL